MKQSRVGYDHVMITIENVSTGDEHTLFWNPESGAFKLFEGIYDQQLPEGDEGPTLADTHIKKHADDLSAWLLKRLDIAHTRSPHFDKGLFIANT